MDDNELLTLPEDEFDALNDETFGDDGGEYNWEESQVLCGGILGNELSNGTARERSNDEEVASTVGVTKTYEELFPYEGQSRETEYDEFENENALEESISRLVLDDFDDDEESVSAERLRRITATKNNYYFMPPQVVNRHLQWFMDKELPGGNSLLGSSVWSMHPTSISSKNDGEDSAPRSNVYSVSTNSTENLRRPDASVVSSSALPAGSELGNLLGLAKSAPGIHSAPALGSKPPSFKTVDEIEQELLRESEKAKLTAKAAEEAKSRPKVMSVEELERQLIQESPAPYSAAEVPQAPRPSVSSQQTGMNLDQIRSTFRGPGMAAPGHSAQGPGVASNATQPPMNANMYFARHGMPLRPLPPRPIGFPHQNNYAQNQNILNSPGVAALQQQLQIRQQQLRFLQMNSPSQFFPVAGPSVPLGGKMPYRFPGGLPQSSHVQSQTHRRPDKTDIGDTGLMTEKDKQRLKNIQIVQLQNDHPHTTDYYCLMRRIRKGGNGQPPMQILKMLFPKKTLDDDANKRHYEPAHFENSLGKLQAQSALAPKKAIDTVIRVIDSGPAAGKKKSYRYLLLEIEKMYECLLAMEEADLRTVVETSGGEEDYEMKAIREKVERFLQDPLKLSEIMTVKKGKVLVCRLAALMDKPVRMVAVQHLFKSFPSWAIPANPNSGSSELIELYPYIRHCVLGMDEHTLESLCLSLDDVVLNQIVTTKLGMSMIMVLLHQGEKVTRVTQISDQSKTAWSKTVYRILAALLRNKQIVTHPVELYVIGLQRLLMSDLHRLSPQVVEELSKLFTGFLNSGSKQIKQDY